MRGSKTRTRLSWSIDPESGLDRSAVVVVVVVAVRGAEKVIDLGGVVLYIVTEPFAQLEPPEVY